MLFVHRCGGAEKTDSVSLTLQNLVPTKTGHQERKPLGPQHAKVGGPEAARRAPGPVDS